MRLSIKHLHIIPQRKEFYKNLLLSAKNLQRVGQSGVALESLQSRLHSPPSVVHQTDPTNNPSRANQASNKFVLQAFSVATIQTKRPTMNQKLRSPRQRKILSTNI
jgi:hypothetical protein